LRDETPAAGRPRRLTEIRDLRESDRTWAGAVVEEHFGSTRVVSRGRLHDTRMLHGLVALQGGVRMGVLHYRIQDAQSEVVTLVAVSRRRGVGRALLQAARSLAGSRGCRRLWLVTTNDNTTALAFYRALGGHRAAIHRGAVREARRLKSEIPAVAQDGTPIEDEIEFEWCLEAG
jgi:ribosomal protein S18 acetylase RimI-like enzyme